MIALLLITGCGNEKKQTANGVAAALLDNSGFEANVGNGVESWNFERYDASISEGRSGAMETVEAPAGQNVLVIENTDFNDARFTQTVSVEKNSYYKLSALVKTEMLEGRNGAETGANIGFWDTPCGSEYVYSMADWTEVTVYGKTDKKTDEATVCLRLGFFSADCKGTAYFDSVTLEKVNEVPENVSVGAMYKTEATNSAEQNGKSVSSVEWATLLRGILYFAAISVCVFFALKNKEKFTPTVLYVALAAALIIRVVASFMYKGFSVDIGCFSAWGRKMASDGITKFYADGYFCDYPPLYMIVLGIISKLASSISLTEGFGLVLLKLPAVLADIVSAYLIYKITEKHTGKNIASILGTVYALLPTAIINSAVWGQVDSILVLFMLLTFALVENDKFGLSVITFFVGMLFKPQAILFGPAMLFAAAREFAVIAENFKSNNKKEAQKRLAFGFGGLGVSGIIFLLLSVIMANGQKLTWLIEKYSDTLGSYNYATLSGFGFMGLLGGQWVDAEKQCLFGMSYSALGTLLMVFVFIFAALLYVLRAKKEKNGVVPTKYLWLIGAITLAGFVIFSTRTHERYIFPAIAMLAICFAEFNDIRLLLIAGGYAFINFVNTGIVLYVYEDFEKYMTAKEPAMILFSLLTVVLYIVLAVIAAKLFASEKNTVPANVKSNKKTQTKNVQSRKNVPLKVSQSQKNVKLEKLLARRNFTLPKVTWKDIVICFVITAIYASVAFTKLGDVKAAQTQWWSNSFEPSVICDLGEETTFDQLVFDAASAGKVKIYTSSDNENYTLYNEASFGTDKIGQWTKTDSKETSARYVKITTQSAVSVCEAAILEKGEQIQVKDVISNVNPIDSLAGNGERLFDDVGCYAKSNNFALPQTKWNSGGEYTVKFANPSKIGEVNVFFSDVNDGAYISVNEPEGIETISAIPAGNGGWQTGIIYNDKNGEYSEVKMYLPEGCASVNELVIKDTDGKTVQIASIKDYDGSEATSDVKNIFDEQSLFDEYDLMAGENYGGEIWKVTSCYDCVIADFGEVKKIDRGYYNVSVCTGSFTVYYSNDGENWTEGEEHTVEQGNLYYWHGLPGNNSEYADLKARYVAVAAGSPGLKMIEMGFFENKDDKSVIPIKEVIASTTGENGGSMLFDEQSLVPTRSTYMNSMYFDEIYHARTAYESLNGLSIYEWTHPPLGKDIMSWSISIFGMTPFGWRFAGALAGVLMVPAMYFVGLMMFRKTSWATVLASVMSLDGMHFAQTRLATIDSYGVLFIILMFLFMYWYYSISFYDVPLKKTFIPLGLCGLSFGLGAASKWIGLYAGAGLAIIFFITVFRRYGEYKVAKENIKTAKGEEKEYLKHIIDVFPKYTAYTLLFCIGAFIVVPLIIYCASYYPYWLVKGETRKWYEIILANQRDMFRYHSQLQATHPFQSDWYTWPVIYRPIYIYSGSELTSPNNVATISSFGNPMVWYAGLVATLFGFYMLVRHKLGYKLPQTVKSAGIYKLFDADDENFADRNERDGRLLLFLTLGVCCNLVPWMGIQRCIFIYHYFATVPFIMMFTVYAFRHLMRTKKKPALVLLIAFLIASLVLFIMFKPVWTGTEVSREYVKTFLKWFDSWAFGV